MGKKTSQGECPVGRAVDVFGDEWSLLIVRDVFDGLRRFGELQKNLGMAKNILASRLRKLVEHGVLEVVPASDGSAFHEYALTAKGRDLFQVIVAMRQWGEAHCFEPGEPHSILVDTRSGRPVPRMELHAKDGRRIESTDAVVRKVSEQKPRVKR
ncbi:helix-turn-helix domain-containing protein [Myxococcus stipitatus]|uniref:winged helix-turn-helix transcriptional regulator n=1 Tax=Myxococcus stipitatus TaxID=83455 RepID=UPI0030CA832F